MISQEVTEGEETPYFERVHVHEGPYDVSDISVGNFNNDDYPDIVLGRGDGGAVTTVLLNDDGTVLDYTYSPLTGGTVLVKAGAAEDKGGQFDSNTLDDIVVTATSEKAVYFVESKGNGYFENPASPTVPEHLWGLENVANMVHHFITDHETTKEGIVMSLGAKPDSLLFTDLSGTENSDVAVAIPDLNQIAIFLGTGDGTFVEGLFISPGKSPRSVVAADFNGDDHNDLACLVDTEDGVQTVILINKAVPESLIDLGQGQGKISIAVARFHSPMEIPMPVAYNWTSGRVVPTHFAVADFDGDELQDVVVVSTPDKQITASEGEKSVPLVFSFMSEKLADSEVEPFPRVPPIKSSLALEFSQELSGFAIGDINGDWHLDLAISAAKTADDPCSGRTFDVLVGGWMTTKTMDDDDDPDADPFLDGLHTDYYAWNDNNPGHFTPMGGYLGLQGPTGIEVARLDAGAGEEYDDIVLLAAENGTPGGENDDYQANTIATYLTRYDDQWGDPADSGQCKTKDMVWYDGAPYWPMEQTDGHCKATEDPPEGTCQPLLGEGGDSSLVKSVAAPSAKTGDFDIPSVPVAAVVADFYPDPSDCMDILVAQSEGVATYLRGVCHNKVYNFDDDAAPPQILDIGFGPVDIDAADLDQDGNYDAVVALANDVVILYGTSGGDSFKPPTSLGIGVDVVPSSVTLADVNDDGREDILITSTPHNLLAVYINAGDKKFSYSSFPTGKEPIDSQVGDINNDGCLDIAVLNSGAKSVTILESSRCDEE